MNGQAADAGDAAALVRALEADRAYQPPLPFERSFDQEPAEGRRLDQRSLDLLQQLLTAGGSTGREERRYIRLDLESEQILHILRARPAQSDLGVRHLAWESTGVARVFG